MKAIRWSCYVPLWSDAYLYTCLQGYFERLILLAEQTNLPRLIGDPPFPGGSADLLPELTASTFFFPDSHGPQLYIKRRIHGVRDSGWAHTTAEFPDLAQALKATAGHILLRKGLGKTTALLHAFWGIFREYRSGANVPLPHWLVPGDALLQGDTAESLPPVVFFVDLQELAAEHQLELAQQVATLAGKPGCQHRFVIAYRAWRKPAKDPVTRKLLEFVSLIFEVEHLSAQDAVLEWSKAGVPAQVITLLANVITERTRTAAPAVLTNVPGELSNFIGRRREIATLTPLLRDSRLLTITGAGGIGKTRLALQLAAELLDWFDDGVWLVELAVQRDATLLPQTIASALGLREDPEQTLVEKLIEYIRTRELLLVLDNFEQVVEAAPFVAELLAKSPALKILVTSRAALRVRGEQEYQLQPLELPDRRVRSAERLAQYEGVALFVHRARGVKPGFALDAQNAADVAEITRRLDGLPLAIELAAARSRILAPHAILARLGRALPLLVGGAAGALHGPPSKQQTLRGAIGWSYDLLDADEKTLFRRLAIFPGGCAIAAVEPICNVDQSLSLDLLIGLEALVDKSLLRQQDGALGEPRFSMFETIREYANEQLTEKGEAAPLQQALADYYLVLAEQASAELKGHDQRHWMATLEVEHDNLRGALNWVLQERQDEIAGRLVGALWWFWYIRGYLSEGRRWLEAVLTRQDALTPISTRRVLQGAGVLAAEMGDFERAAVCFNRSLELCRQLGLRSGIAEALNSLGMLSYHQEQYGEAQAYYTESLALARELDDRNSISVALNNLGGIAHFRGALETAAQLYQESLDLERLLEDAQGIASALNNLAEVALDQDDHARAGELYAEGLRLSFELGDRQNIAVCLEGLAGTAGALNNSLRAARLFGAAQVLREEIDAPLESWYLPTYQRLVEAAKSCCEGSEWDAAWSEGRELTLEQAVEEALVLQHAVK